MRWLFVIPVVAVLIWWLKPEVEVITAPAGEPLVGEPEQGSAAPVSVVNDEKESDTPILSVAPEPEVEVSNRQPGELDSDAIASLRESMVNGDSRAPKLNKTRQRDELPSAEELADPELYQRYERRQQNRMYRAYVEASKIKVAELEKMIERGKQEGISDEQIQFAEDKIKGIQDMAAQLQIDHPEIMEDNYTPADDWLVDNLGIEDPQSETENTLSENKN